MSEKAKRPGGPRRSRAGANGSTSDKYSGDSAVKVVLGRLHDVTSDGAHSWRALCPIHNGHSLIISRGETQPVVIKCWGGCAAEDILAKLGLTWGDIISPNGAGPAPAKETKGEPLPSTATIEGWRQNLLQNPERLKELCEKKGLSLYTIRNAWIGWDGSRYTIPIFDEHGSLINVRRYSFTADKKMLGLKGRPSSLYPADEPVGEDGTAVLGEGEWDALLARQKGIPAVTTTGGAEVWKPEWSAKFAGLDVHIVMDRDKAGQRGAKKRAKALRGIARSRRIVKLPNPKRIKGYDLGDFLLEGNTARDLYQLAMRAPLSEKKDEGTIAAADVKAVHISWLWQDRIARGFLNLVTGAPGVGKSTILYDLAARVSREGGVVLIATAEDHWAAVVRPRLEAAGADLGRVHILTEDLTLPHDAETLQDHARRLGASFIMVDPVVAFLSAGIDSHKDASVRQALRPLGKMAEDLHAAVVAVLHTNKGSSEDPAARISASIGFQGAARQILLACPDPQDQTHNVLAVVKSNLAVFRAPLAYTIETAFVTDAEGDEITTSRIRWGEELPGLDPRSLLAQPDKPSTEALEEAQDFLRQSIAEGEERPAAELLKEAKEQLGIATTTLHRARKELGIKSRRDGFGGPWLWRHA